MDESATLYYILTSLNNNETLRFVTHTKQHPPQHLIINYYVPLQAQTSETNEGNKHHAE